VGTRNGAIMSDDGRTSCVRCFPRARFGLGKPFAQRGPMSHEWSDPNKVGVVIAHLQRVLGLNAEGNVTLPLGGDLDSGVEIITSQAKFSKQVPEGRRVTMARRAVIDSRKASNLTLEGVWTRILAGQRDYLKQEPKPFVLLTSLSIEYSKTLTTLRPSRAVVTFTPMIPRHFELPASAQRSPPHYGPPPKNYTTVRVRVSARDPMSAGELALERLDLVRAIWNLFRNQTRWRVSFGARGRPINDIVPGPIHTIHHPDGSPASELIWWEPSYVQPLSLLDVAQDYGNTRKFERWIRARLAESPMRAELEEMLVRYVRALDERDLNPALVKLWGLLEDLTATNRAPHDVTVRRAVFLLKDISFRRLVLQNLKDWRNRIVHEGRETGEGERMVQEVKQPVEILLMFLLRNATAFRNLDEFGEFLDLPTEAAIIGRRIKFHRMAHNLHKS
jgi:hypothetical protein